jgi:hypothetical protein
MDHAQERADIFRQFLSAEIGEPLVLESDRIPVEMVQIRSEPGEVSEMGKPKRRERNATYGCHSDTSNL